MLIIAVPKSASTPDLSRTGFYWLINTRISHTSHLHVCQQAVTTCADDTLVLYKPYTIDFVPMTATSCPSSPVAMVTVALQTWRCHNQQ